MVEYFVLKVMGEKLEITEGYAKSEKLLTGQESLGDVHREAKYTFVSLILWMASSLVQSVLAV